MTHLTESESNELLRLCAAATPGPWVHNSKCEVGYISTDDDQSFGMLIPLHDAETVEDAAFIAAFNPQTAMRLLKQLEELRAWANQCQTERDTANDTLWSLNSTMDAALAREVKLTEALKQLRDGTNNNWVFAVSSAALKEGQPHD